MVATKDARLEARAAHLLRTKSQGAVETLRLRKLMASLGMPGVVTTYAQQIRQQTLVRVARHEAGHATVGLALGGVVWGARVWPDSPRVLNGVVYVTWPKEGNVFFQAFSLGGMCADGSLSGGDAQGFLGHWLADSAHRSARESFRIAHAMARRALAEYADLHAEIMRALVQQSILYRWTLEKMARRHGIEPRRPLRREERWWKVHEINFRVRALPSAPIGK